jgi:hypothetical protein
MPGDMSRANPYWITQPVFPNPYPPTGPFPHDSRMNL